MMMMRGFEPLIPISGQTKAPQTMVGPKVPRRGERENW